MTALLEIAPPRLDRRDPRDGSAATLNLVAVVSRPSQGAGGDGIRRSRPVHLNRSRHSQTRSRRLQYARVPIHLVASSAAWMRRRSGKAGIRTLTAGWLGSVPGRAAELPRDQDGILALLRQEGSADLD